MLCRLLQQANEGNNDSLIPALSNLFRSEEFNYYFKWGQPEGQRPGQLAGQPEKPIK